MPGQKLGVLELRAHEVGKTESVEDVKVAGIEAEVERILVIGGVVNELPSVDKESNTFGAMFLLDEGETAEAERNSGEGTVVGVIKGVGPPIKALRSEVTKGMLLLPSTNACETLEVIEVRAMLLDNDADAGEADADVKEADVDDGVGISLVTREPESDKLNSETANAEEVEVKSAKRPGD